MVFSKKFNTLEDFLRDDEFIRLACRAEQDESQWNLYCKRFKDNKLLAEEARRILAPKQYSLSSISLSEKDELKQQILGTISALKKLS
jgi:hypothetical protein